MLIINKQIHSVPQWGVLVRPLEEHVQEDFGPLVPSPESRTVYAQTVGTVFLLEEPQATNLGEPIWKDLPPPPLGKWVFLFDPKPDLYLGRMKSH